MTGGNKNDTSPWDAILGLMIFIIALGVAGVMAWGVSASARVDFLSVNDRLVAER